MTLAGSFKNAVEPFVVDDIPTEAALVMSALEAGIQTRAERRQLRRYIFRSATTLRLFRDEPSAPPSELYTRDINRRGMGFITRHRLPLGYGGVVILPNQDGTASQIHCTLLRCREAAPGWYEGSVSFSRDQPQFDYDNA